MDDRSWRTAQAFEGCLDELATALGQHLNRDVVGDEVVLDEQTKKTIPLHGEVDVVGARAVAENWQAFGLQQEPPPVDRAIDLSYLEEAQK